MILTNNLIETRSCYINKVQNTDNILRIEKKLGETIDLDELRDIDRAYESLLQDKKGKFLIVFSEDCSLDKAIKERLASRERSSIKKAEALVIKTLANRLEANFYKRKYQQQHPIEVFESEEAGIEWLSGLN